MTAALVMVCVPVVDLRQAKVALCDRTHGRSA